MTERYLRKHEIGPKWVLHYRIDVSKINNTMIRKTSATVQRLSLQRNIPGSFFILKASHLTFEVSSLCPQPSPATSDLDVAEVPFKVNVLSKVAPLNQPSKFMSTELARYY